MTEFRLAMRQVSRVYPGGAGVHAVSLDVAAGEIHALVGLNGAGKTTLMRLMLGMLCPDAGAVLIGGLDIATAPSALWVRVGHLVEQPFAYPELTTQSNLALAARLRGVPTAAIADMVTHAIVELHLGEYAGIRAGRLSKGNRQRLGLAAALQHDADVIVLDEPTTALDPAGVRLLRAALQRRAAAGAGILVSSHHLDEVARIANRITVLNRGGVIGALDPGGVDIERAFFALVHADDERRAA